MSYDQWKTASPDDGWLEDNDQPPYKLITKFDPPPIPDRQFDWSAHWLEDEDRDEGNTHNWGWGATEKEAVADLQRLDQERAEWEEEASAEYFDRYIAGDR